MPVFTAATDFAGAGIEVAAVATVACGATGSGTVNAALENDGFAAGSSFGAEAISTFVAEGVVAISMFVAEGFVARSTFVGEGVVAISIFDADGVAGEDSRDANAESGAGIDKF